MFRLLNKRVFIRKLYTNANINLNELCLPKLHNL